jgi:hypothetical protein
VAKGLISAIALAESESGRCIYTAFVKLAELDRTESRHARLDHAAAGTSAMLRHSINRRLKAAR